MRPDRTPTTKTQKVWNRRVNALSGLSKLRPDLQYQWVHRKTEYTLNGYCGGTKQGTFFTCHSRKWHVKNVPHIIGTFSGSDN